MERTRIPKIKKVFGKPGFASRAGIIPYVVSKSGKVRILLGIKEGKFTDFGGGCKKKESSLNCAIREFTEETLGVLSIDVEKDLTHILVGGGGGSPPYSSGGLNPDEYQLIMFVKVKSFEGVIKRFDKAKDKVERAGSSSEHEAIEVMDLERFVGLGGIYFRKVVRSMKKDIELVLSTL